MASYDLLVGVDLGMTSTGRHEWLVIDLLMKIMNDKWSGVAYKTAKTSGIRHVEWTSSGEVFRKCPTTLEYELNKNINQFSLKACGMNCAYRYPSIKGKAIRDQQIRYVEWFKLFLEPAYLKTAIEKRIPSGLWTTWRLCVRRFGWKFIQHRR